MIDFGRFWKISVTTVDFLSIFANFRDYFGIIIDYFDRFPVDYPLLSICTYILNSCQFCHFRRFSSIFVDFRRFSLIFIDFRRFSSISISNWSILEVLNRLWLISIHVDFGGKTSKSRFNNAYLNSLISIAHHSNQKID